MLVTLEELEPRQLVRKVITGMEQQDLLTSASAIAFQVLIPGRTGGSRSGRCCA